MLTGQQPIRFTIAILATAGCIETPVIAQHITHLDFTGPGSVPRLTIQSELRISNQIQYTNNLWSSNWPVLVTVVATQSPYTFLDMGAPPAHQRFYRVVALPMEGMVWIPPGTFTMGSPIGEVDRSSDEGPQTTVTLSRGFFIGRYEVTQGEYLAVTGRNPSWFASATNAVRPVEQVNWSDATNYCYLLNQRETRLGSGWEYRLPTEAEWEYACRAGTTTRFYYGDDPGYARLTDFAWFLDNSANSTHPVGQKLPNPWGLYDMAGNVWEWCQDWYGAYAGGSLTDPQRSASGGSRVLRGGSWGEPASYARSARRLAPGDPSVRHWRFGLRVVLAMTAAPNPGPELLCDPGFETSTPDGTFPNSGCWQPAWLYTAGPPLCTITAGFTGNGLWQYTGVEPASWWSGPFQAFTAAQGLGYRAAALLRCPPGQPWLAGSKALVRVEFRDDAGSLIAQYDSPPMVAATTNWSPYAVTTPVTPSNAAQVRFILYLEKPAAEGQSVVNWDNCSLQTMLAAPTIVTPPVNATTLPGSNISFSVTSVGSPPLTYQWQFNGTGIAGATNRVLQLTNITTDSVGSYRALVTGPGGSVTSAPAMLSLFDLTRPMLVAFSPAPNLNNVPGNAAISLVYSMPIDPASVTPKTIAVSGSQSGRLTNQASFSVTGNTVWVSNMTSFLSGEVVQVVATTGISAAGSMNCVKPFVWQFSTKVAPSSGVFTNSGVRLERTGTDDYPAALATGDFNGDGRPDLALIWANHGPSWDLEFRLNDGTGGFTNASQSLPVTLGNKIILSDLEGRGALNALVPWNAGLFIFSSDGLGHFTASQSIGLSYPTIAVADVNGDGFPDIVVGAGSLSSADSLILLNDGGHFVASEQRFPGRVGGVATGDLNGDGLPDVVFASDSSHLDQSVWLNDGTGHFTNTFQIIGNSSYQRSGVQLCDLNNDGFLDLLLVENAKVVVYFNDGAGRFTRSGQQPFGQTTDRIILVDVNGDGNKDVVLVNDTEMVGNNRRLWRNNGGGYFYDMGQLPGPGLVYEAAAADFNGDGAIDLFFGGVDIDSTGLGVAELWFNRKP